MEKQVLNENWRLHYKQNEYQTSVPFSLYYDLLNNEVIDDPFYRDNAAELMQLSEHDYVYSNEFEFCNDIDVNKKYILFMDRVDTVSDVYLNGVLVGSTDNMFCFHEFNVEKALKKGKNELKVEFVSPIRYMNEQNEKYGKIPCNTDTLDGYPYLRKASCMSGWDWAPRLPDMGIYKEVSIIIEDKGRFEDVRIRQRHEERRVFLDLNVKVEFNSKQTQEIQPEYVVTIKNPMGQECVWAKSPQLIEIEEPKLWWPRGFGEQNLYEVKVELYFNDEMQDVYTTRIGLRTITVAREKDQWGECFAHEVNGIRIFAMGADYIPEDCLVPRITKETTRRLLEQCVLANYNTIRIWGGGYYPDEWFYDFCDKFGFIVWQDAMFCCSTYRATPEFIDNITKEITQNVRRLRNHASIGLWSGNNEIEGFFYDGWFGEVDELKEDYLKIFEQVIPEIMQKESEETFYWPSSPSSGGNFDNPNDATRGDAHYWKVWHAFKPFSEYRKHNFRYASEFGFESLPAYKTIESFTNEEDRNIFSYVMERHQKSNMGYAKMMNYMAQTFLYPTDFKILIYASQLMQAEAMKYAVEHWRRNRGECMGAVIWQLNDCWPVASWSSVDCFGRWKALHYYEKRFFAPIMISCHEEGQLSQDPNPNARPYPLEKSFKLNVTNETLAEREVTVSYSIRDADSRVIGEEHTVKLVVPALSAVWLDKVECSDADIFTDHIRYSCAIDDDIVSEGTAIFTMPKFYKYKNPHLKFKVEGEKIVVKAERYAKAVEILNENEDIVLSDNYFDMEAGERTIEILSGDISGLRVRSVYDIR